MMDIWGKGKVTRWMWREKLCGWVCHHFFEQVTDKYIVLGALFAV